MAAFGLERYLADLRDLTAWAPDCGIAETAGGGVPRATLYRIAHLWALGLLDIRSDTLLLPILIAESPLLDALDRENRARNWDLSRAFFEERLESGACLLLFDGVEEEEAWPRNQRFVAAR